MDLSTHGSRFHPAQAIPRLRIWLELLLAITLSVMATATPADPPTRVARLSVITGEVGFAAADDENWQAASLNRPLTAGDRLYTERDARAELDLGTAALRLDERSDLHVLDLDAQLARIDLSEGTLNLSVRNLYAGQRYEITTPTLTLVVNDPSALRLDVREDATQVTVFAGEAEVYGENAAYQRVSARRSYRFADNALRDIEEFDLPQPDAFDDWCLARDQRSAAPVARRYVSDEVIGYADLDDYGDWQEESDYGPVWYPRRVVTGWAPYRDGHWAWVEPWGWTWVDDAPWGFAPSHYGRWVCVRERWGWIPGPPRSRPVYAPALVAFIGADIGSIGYAQGSRPVGWYPLGPRDVYEPPYRVSRHYFSNVNVTNIHNHTVINNVYTTYAGGRPRRDLRHDHRDNPRAVTVVGRDTFSNPRPVSRAHKPLRADAPRHAVVIPRPEVQPPRQRDRPRADAPTSTRPNRTLGDDMITHRLPMRPEKPAEARGGPRAPLLTPQPVRSVNRPASAPDPDRQTAKRDQNSAGVHLREGAHTPRNRRTAPQEDPTAVLGTSPRVGHSPPPPQTHRQDDAQPRKVVQSPRHPSSSFVPHRETRQPPTAAAGNNRQARSTARAPQAPTLVANARLDDATKDSRRKARARQRGTEEDTRPGRAHAPSTPR